MSLIGHHGGLQIGKAERPGPSLGKINKDHQSKSEKSSSSQSSNLERRGLSQMLGGILHSQRRDEAQARASFADDRSETASISSIATEKRALLGRNKSGSSGRTPKLVNVNETLMPPVKHWS
ncbi:hypothetical protein V8C42DRAFT_341208 [Trichoderma barbatum]